MSIRIYLAYVIIEYLIFSCYISPCDSFRFGRRINQKIPSFNVDHENLLILHCSSKDAPKPRPKVKVVSKKKVPDDPTAKVWESGNIFTEEEKKKKRSNSNIAWWMNRDEDSNPLMLPKYIPWWIQKNFLVDSSWELKQLQEEAKRRGLSTEGGKKILIESINDLARKYDLSDDNFTEPIFKKPEVDSLPRCYPEVYNRK